MDWLDEQLMIDKKRKEKKGEPRPKENLKASLM
jgi:hypothetical protein